MGARFILLRVRIRVVLLLAAAVVYWYARTLAVVLYHAGNSIRTAPYWHQFLTRHLQLTAVQLELLHCIGLYRYTEYE